MSKEAEDQRGTERARRDLAQGQRGSVVEGSGRPVEGRKVPQMVSLRVDPDVLAELRGLAEASGLSVSDLLRQAAGQLLAASKQSRFHVRIDHVETGISPARHSGPNDHLNVTTGSALVQENDRSGHSRLVHSP
jgi:hypothetical protein